MGRRSFGQITGLPSGRYQARYQVPGSRPRRYVTAPTTFTTKRAAQSWLSRARVELEDGVAAPSAKATQTTLEDYCREWIATRRSARGGPLRASTRAAYTSYLNTHIAPTIGHLTLSQVTRDIVRSWYADISDSIPTMKARTFAFLRTVLGTAVEDGLIAANPCQIRGASSTPPVTKVVVATPAQVLELANAMPAHLRLAVLLGAWVQTRVGEVLELRRGDISLEAAAIRIERGVTFVERKPVVGPPKTEAGIRTVAIPPHIVADVRDHLEDWVAKGGDSLLFPRTPGASEHMYVSTFGYHLKQAARRTSLPPTFTFHHLRHSGLTLAAQSGATVAELQARAGHSTPSMAMHYQHSADERDQTIAKALSKAVEGDRR